MSGDGGVWRAANGCVAYAPNTYGGQGCDVGKSAMSGKSEISGEEWMRSWGDCIAADGDCVVWCYGWHMVNDVCAGMT